LITFNKVTDKKHQLSMINNLIQFWSHESPNVTTYSPGTATWTSKSPPHTGNNEVAESSSKEILGRFPQ
jgi:hypothetical protein